MSILSIDWLFQASQLSEAELLEEREIRGCVEFNPCFMLIVQFCCSFLEEYSCLTWADVFEGLTEIKTTNEAAKDEKLTVIKMCRQ